MTAPVTLTPPRATATPREVASAYGISPLALHDLRTAFRNEAAVTPPRLIFTEATALELAKLVRPEWLKLGIHIAEHRDYSVTVDGDPDPAEWIVVTVGLPTDGPKFQRGRGYALAEAIANTVPVNAGGTV